MGTSTKGSLGQPTRASLSVDCFKNQISQGIFTKDPVEFWNPGYIEDLYLKIRNIPFILHKFWCIKFKYLETFGALKVKYLEIVDASKLSNYLKSKTFASSDHILNSHSVVLVNYL